MVKVITTTKDGYISNVRVTGHSGYDIDGKDIVCSAVSSITITTINALVKYDQKCIKYEEKEGLIDLMVLKNDNLVKLLIKKM